MAHQLGALYDLPHGVCNGILLPIVVEFNESAASARYGPDRRASSAAARPVAACPALLRSLGDRVGLPRGLAALGVERSRIPDLAAARDDRHVHGHQPATDDRGGRHPPLRTRPVSGGGTAMGMLEVHGLTAAIGAADAMAKAAPVRVDGPYLVGCGLVTIVVRGDIAAVIEAVEAGAAAAGRARPADRPTRHRPAVRRGRRDLRLQHEVTPPTDMS